MKLLTGASRYAAQRRKGFKSLAFVPEMETEYREYRMPIMQRRLASLFHISGFGLFSYLVIDRLVDEPKLTPLSIGFLMAAIAITVLMVFVSRHSDRAEALDTNVAFGTTAFGLCIVASILAAQPQLPIGSLFVTLIAIYFVAGMPTRKASIVALFITAVYVAGVLLKPGPSPATFGYTLLFLLMVNLVGVFGEYQIEFEARRTFLLQMELRDLAQHDGLTRLLNRRAFRRQLQVLWRQAERDGKGVGLMVVDLDHLKWLNDTWGHSTGDRCIGTLADVLRRSVHRPLDIAGRFGGDEFVVAWFDVDPDWLGLTGEAIRREVEQAGGGQRALPHFTVSIGAIHLYPNGDCSIAQALQQADQNLYAAKQHSRNQLRYTRLRRQPRSVEEAEASAV